MTTARREAASPMPIRAVCFDLDNTLWDVWPVIMRAERAMYDFLTERYPRVVANVTIEELRAARERVALEHPQMQHDFSFLRKQALRNHARVAGYHDELVEEAFDVFIRARNQIDLYADVLPGLELLRGCYRLSTASNGNADLAKVGIAHWFERSISAREVGALKPDPVIFRKIVEGTDLSMDEVLYVGDDPALDVVGARAAGMRTAWINRNADAWPEAFAPADFVVTTLTELAAILGCVVPTPHR
ncbi:MAG: HAD family hydrolase [Steroidobacteraceae bacterium]